MHIDGKFPNILLSSLYQLPVAEANILIDDWLSQNPDQSHLTLYNLIESGKIIVKNGVLHKLSSLSLEEAYSLAREIQADRGVEIKNRWYNLRLYRQCFIGSELVDWLVETKGISTQEAIILGQSLLGYRLIRHVCDDHDFKNEFLFYRFQNIALSTINFSNTSQT
ncbi:MAG: hypothetical protein QNJ53_19865 [Pleurocapsa sp. MO_192.B19]|nr:hypothetical protein [Pleurocapsa sp. MO_192.B19]